MTELFHEQSSRWPDIAQHHIRKVHDETSGFVRRALTYVVKEENVRSKLYEVLDRSLSNNFKTASSELQKLCDDEKFQPMTYNHDYTDNVQSSRNEPLKQVVEKIKDALPGGGIWNVKNNKENHALDPQKILAPVEGHLTVDMDQHACQEAATALDAYYKVSRFSIVY